MKPQNNGLSTNAGPAHGIRVREVSGTLLNGDNTNHNTGNGVSVEESSNTAIVEQTANRNTLDGIFIDAASSATTLVDTVTNNNEQHGVQTLSPVAAFGTIVAHGNKAATQCVPATGLCT